MLHAADKKPQRTVPVSWLLLHPPPVTAASQNPQISHWWWLEQTELEWRGRELLLSAQLETAMQKLHLLLYSWTFFHLVNMQWSSRILCLPPRCLLYTNYLDTPSLNRSPSSKAATQEATADVVFSGPTWCPANASRKGLEKALLPVLWSPRSSPVPAPVLEHLSQLQSKGLSMSKWGSYSWAPSVSHNVLPCWSSDTETQIRPLITAQQFKLK